MAIFVDTFVEASNVALSSHVPDTGTSWTLLWTTTDEATTGCIVLASNDFLQQVTSNNAGHIYTCDGTYPSADYEIEVTLAGHGTNVGHTIYLFVRIQDQENMYAVKLTDNNATNTCQLYKKVSGTWTALGSLFNPPAVGSVMKLEIIGSSLKFYDDGVEVASATDTDITAAGKAGVGGGGGAELVTSNDDGTTANRLDDLTITDRGGITGSLAKTFAGMTLDSDGVLVVTGSLAKTFAGMTLDSDGVLVTEGSLAKTFAGMTLVSTGDIPLTGSLAKTFAGMTLESDGTVEDAEEGITGTLAETFDNMTVSSLGILTVEGSLSETFAGMTLESDGVLVVEGSLAKTFAGMTLESDGELSGVTGTVNVTFAGMSLDSNGETDIEGTLAETFAGMTLVSTGGQVVVGSLVKTFAGMTLDSDGDIPLTGSLNKTFAGMTLDSNGEMEIEGTLAKTFAGMTVDSDGFNGDIEGQLAETFQGMTLSSVVVVSGGDGDSDGLQSRTGLSISITIGV